MAKEVRNDSEYQLQVVVKFDGVEGIRTHDLLDAICLFSKNTIVKPVTYVSGRSLLMQLAYWLPPLKTAPNSASLDANGRDL